MSRLILCPRQNTEQGCTLTNCLFKHRTRVCIEFGKSQCFLGSTCNKFHVYSLRKDESKVLLVKAATVTSPTRISHTFGSNTMIIKKRAKVVDDAYEQDGEIEFKNEPLDRGSTSFFDWYPPVYDDQNQDATVHESGHAFGSGSGSRSSSAPTLEPRYATRMHAPVLARASASPQVGQSIAHVGQDTSATWAVPVFGMNGSIGINSSETGLILPNPDYGDQFPLNFGKPPIYEPEQVDLDSIVDAAPLTSLAGLGARTGATSVLSSSAATMYKTSTSRRRRKRGKRGKHSRNKSKYGKTESKASASRDHSDKTETDSDSDTDSDIEEGQVPFNPAIVKQCATFNCPNATARDFCSDCIGHSIRNNAGSYKAPELTGKAAHFMTKHGL